MTLSSASKIYLYEGDAKFIKEQLGHELIESYKQNNDVKQIQAEMQKEIAGISQKQKDH